MQLNFAGRGNRKESGERTFTEADLKAAFEKVSSLSTSGLVVGDIDLSKELRCELFLVAAGAAVAAGALVNSYSDDDIAEKMRSALKKYVTLKVLSNISDDPDGVAEAIKKCKAECYGD